MCSPSPSGQMLGFGIAIAPPRHVLKSAPRSGDMGSAAACSGTSVLRHLSRRSVRPALSLVLAFRRATREAQCVWAPRPRPEWLEELNALVERPVATSAATTTSTSTSAQRLAAPTDRGGALLKFKRDHVVAAYCANNQFAIETFRTRVIAT